MKVILNGSFIHNEKIFPEIFPDGPRALGLSIGAMSNYFCNLIIGFCFPLIQASLQEMSFSVFIIISFLVGLFVIL